MGSKVPAQNRRLLTSRRPFFPPTFRRSGHLWAPDTVRLLHASSSTEPQAKPHQGQGSASLPKWGLAKKGWNSEHRGLCQGQGRMAALENQLNRLL